MELFDRFLQERTYLKGVSPNTLDYYKCVRRAFAEILTQPTKEGMKDCIVKLLDAGVSPTSVNTYLRGFKAYMNWLHQEGLLDAVWKVQFLRTEQKILATFSPAHIQAFVHWKPERNREKQIRALVLCLSDTGLRINELLCLRRENVNLDGLTLLVLGKGNRQRLVPMSIELRKHLYRHLASHEHARVFSTKQGAELSQRNILRDFKAACKRMGIVGVRTSFHTFRHTFAVNYLKRGGNLEFLRRILGHSSILTTQKYLRSLGVEDLSRVHGELTLLAR